MNISSMHFHWLFHMVFFLAKKMMNFYGLCEQRLFQFPKTLFCSQSQGCLGVVTQQVKLSFGLPTSHIGVPLIVFNQHPGLFQRVCGPDGNSVWIGPCQLHGRPGQHCWFLVSTWPNPTCCRHLQRQSVDRRSFILFFPPFVFFCHSAI